MLPSKSKQGTGATSRAARPRKRPAAPPSRRPKARPASAPAASAELARDGRQERQDHDAALAAPAHCAAGVAMSKRNASSTSPSLRCRTAAARGFRPSSAAPDRCSGSSAWRLLADRRSAGQACLAVPSPSRDGRALLHRVRQRRGAIGRPDPGGARRRPDRRPGGEAHQIINTGASELRYLAISDINTVDIIEYPVGKGRDGRRREGRQLSSASYKAMGRVTPADYFDGEDPNDKR